MSAREALYAFGMRGKYHSPDNSECMSEKIDAFKDEVQRELIRKMRGQLAAGLRMPGFARVLVLGGKFEPLSTTHVLDAWDPDRDGTMRPAGEALEELYDWPRP